MYGEGSSLYLGAGKSALWFAVGGDEAVVELKRAIDLVVEPVRNPTQALPFQAVMNVSEWLEIVDPLKRAKLSRQALTDGKDTVRFDIQGTQDGVRFRLRFDEGFTKLVGLGLIQGAEADERRRAAAEAAKQKAAETKPESDSAPEMK